jgi:hydroxymethylglutaryl-CoA lyase
MGSEEATTRIIATARKAVAAGHRVQLSVQSAFGCGFEGPVPEERVLEMVRAYVDAGFRSISLADTAGHARPSQVERLFGAVFGIDPTIECACHFHNTYGLALANCYAARRVGVKYFEASVAGLGGCPFTRVAGGNTCTEDLVHAFQRDGLRRDIRLDALLEVARDVARCFARDLPGSVYRSGAIPEPAVPAVGA